MRQVKAVPISHENFAPYGQFYTMTDPKGYALCGEIHQFFPDRMTGAAYQSLGFSPILVKKPDPMIINMQEYHTTTWEMIMPLNDDMILHVAPASAGKLVPELSEVFIVPQNTLVKINTNIWHLAPLPVNVDELCAMIILPECTYANDCTAIAFEPGQEFEIVL